VRNPDIRLLVTDLDGTLIGHRDERRLYPDFKAQLADLRRTSQTTWLICTGRHYASFRRFFRPMEKAGLRPDLVATRHRLIYRRRGEDYVIMPLFSLTVLVRFLLAHRDALSKLKQMHGHLQRTTRGVRRVVLLPDRFSLRFATEESADAALLWVQKEIQERPSLHVDQKGREIEVCEVSRRRGLVVSSLGKSLGVARDEVLTIGDSSGDLCMLDHRIAIHTGCPLTADQSVLLRVNRNGGHISPHYTLEGVMDVIRATLSGTVSSELPAEPVEMPRHHRTRLSHVGSKSRQETLSLRSYILLGAVGGITVVVCASFGILPLSGLIMKPVNWLFRVIADLVGVIP